jgi:hypothetical protein
MLALACVLAVGVPLAAGFYARRKDRRSRRKATRLD